MDEQVAGVIPHGVREFAMYEILCDWDGLLTNVSSPVSTTGFW